jgi:hypothetical protein
MFTNITSHAGALVTAIGVLTGGAILPAFTVANASPATWQEATHSSAPLIGAVPAGQINDPDPPPLPQPPPPTPTQMQPPPLPIAIPPSRKKSPPPAQQPPPPVVPQPGGPGGDCTCWTRVWIPLPPMPPG